MVESLVFRIESNTWHAGEGIYITDTEVVVPIEILNQIKNETDLIEEGFAFGHFVTDTCGGIKLPRNWSILMLRDDNILVFDESENARICFDLVNKKCDVYRRFTVKAVSLTMDNSVLTLSFEDKLDKQENFTLGASLVESSRKANGKEDMSDIEYLQYMGDIALGKLFPEHENPTMYWKHVTKGLYRNLLDRYLFHLI